VQYLRLEEYRENVDVTLEAKSVSDPLLKHKNNTITKHSFTHYQILQHGQNSSYTRYGHKTKIFITVPVFWHFLKIKTRYCCFSIGLIMVSIQWT